MKNRTKLLHILPISLVALGVAGCIETSTEPEDQNEAPVVSIEEPTSGASYTSGSVVTFQADVTDPDGWCPTMVWESSIDGEFHTEDSTGLSYCRAGLDFGWSGLSEGTHTITVRATDSGGATTSATVSVTIESAPSAWSDIAAGFWHTCGITASAEDAYCWGYDLDRTPTGVPSAPGGFTSIAAGFDHTCGMSGQSLYCWGDNDSGQLGTGPGGHQSTPQQVSGSWSDVGVGSFSSCAVDTSGGLYCWGSNDRGQLGNGNTADAGAPTPVAGSQVWSSVTVGNRHACAITTSGDAWCWGHADAGELGDGQTGSEDCDEDTFGNWDCSTTPVQVAGGQSWDMLSAGDDFTCGITTAGAMYCWGYGDAGQLGTGTRSDHSSPAPVQGGQSWRHVAAGDAHTCGITTSGAAHCWGYSNAGQLGDGETRTGNDVYQLTPVQVAGGHSWSTVSAGGLFSCGVTTSASAYCWGDNFYGQLGTGGGDSNTPVRLGN